jgi:hypothetical protein
MIIINPHYPDIVLSFVYHGCKVEIERDQLDGYYIYSAWVNHDQGCAVAVPGAMTTKDAIHQAKQWIDQKLK